ncbi:hypothetical protein BO94DRAFT_516518 [Aspergillus sclerotioniger CBS 115572]|uniref:Zn(2)-C6 fungal-type domain-containing protein n=1 Tax=Aspergillus sclerotioniger CBS 115572 TaxID=1450535 RepID=A0A317WRX5_9EURO|nr:hypothetical protein BO94DRAFT_516518 [Aspergillus sclerotioniger CBS 115572]PWY88062.1 hypothetical protein BO94DRAFT_516518 [Aspergillus sclerotioniger CBS 115572]
MSTTPGTHVSPGPLAKRRKIRKGTSSCWECKRRKIRCTFSASSDETCIGCQRRGTKCLSQEFPDQTSGEGQPIGDRIGRVEALVNQLVKNTPVREIAPRYESDGPTETATPTPTGTLSPIHISASTSIPSAVGASLEPSADGLDWDYSDAPPMSHQSPIVPARYAKVSQALYASLPSRDDVEVLWKVHAHASISFNRVMMVPYPELERNGLNCSSMNDVPGPESHPVRLAIYMFLIATVLQYMDLEKSKEQVKALSEPPRAMMKRLAETAIRLVTTHEELLDTVEGLTCVMMEGIYQANCGNLRPAWIAFRRAMALAQLMGLHRPGGCRPLRLLDPNYKFDASFLWYRIVYTDRFLCLMLGLPQGSLDRSMAAEAALAHDTPLGRLERTHCAIASRILERNDADPASYNMSTIREIDLELQDIAQTMPSGWWLAPNLANTHGDPTTGFWEMLRLVTQLYHFNLLNQLHLPFMLQFASTTQLHNYCASTCVNASREILSRFIAFRAFNRVAYCCRAVDFFALIASLLVLIAHLRQHARPPDELNLLAHQRQGDRAMVEQAVASMEELGRVSHDPLSARSADLLRRLLSIEAEAARGRIYRTQSVRIGDEPEAGTGSTGNVLRIRIPYFGTVKIAPKGGVSKESPSVVGESNLAGVHGQNVMDYPDVMSAPQAIGTTTQENHISTNGTNLQAEYLYPGLTAGAEDWAFQGVDMAFFENLMRGTMQYTE